MNLERRKIIAISIGLLTVISLFAFSNSSFASVYDNLRGYASSSVGMIDLNCMNTSCNNAATSTDWGVNVAKDGTMSGYASSSVGFINFAPTGPYPSNQYNMQESANYSSTTGQVSGWVKNESLGDDGWIELRDAGSDITHGTYSTSTNRYGFPFTFDFYFYVPTFAVYVNTSTGNFAGYAYGWYDDSPYSWISFNCATEGTCGTLNYNVNLNWQPEALNMSAPNWSPIDACGSSVRKAFLRWEYYDFEATTQSAYRVVVTTSDSPTSSVVLDTNKVIGTETQYALDEGELDYGIAYYWWVQLWDGDDRPSQLIQYSSPTDTDNDDSVAKTFTIYNHEMPAVAYTYLPTKPVIGENTDFVASTTTFGGASVASYLWESATDAVIGNSAGATTTIKFGSYGNQWARLTVTDSDGYYCSYYENIDTNNEVYDYAWSDNIGWISFNCANEAGSCETSDYGVAINSAAGTFSGYAWNDEVGWISFQEGTSTPPDNYNFAKNCDADVVCDATNDCTACYNSTDHQLYGWAYAISKGDDGWISLNCTNKNECADSDYKVSVNPSTGKFSGYAWSDTSAADDIGWISWNCADEGICGTAEYSVYVFSLSDLEIINMSAPNWSAGQACGSLGAKRAILRWTLNGSTQSAYEIVIDDDAVRDDDTPIFETGKVMSTANQYSCPNQTDACILDYDQSYFWWARVWDDQNATSTWVQFDTYYGHTITHNSDYNTLVSSEPSQTFTTYKHEFPNPYITWSPYEIQVDEPTVFSATSSTEMVSGSELACTTANCSFFWSSEDIGLVIEDNTNVTSTITFGSRVNRAIKLKVTDADGYYCSTSTPEWDTLFQLPIWREVIGGN